MSASREKKQRQANEEPVISSRQQEELEKAAQRKRNTIIYTIIGVVVVILAAILLIWDSGVFQRSASVATIDGEKVTAPQVSYYYHSNPVIQVTNTYSQYGMTLPYSMSVSPKDQVITESAVEEFNMFGVALDAEYVGKTYHDYFLDHALDSLRSEYTLCAAAKEAGYTISDEGKAAIEDEFDALDSSIETYLSYGYNFNRNTYLKMIYGDNMTEKAFRSCMENATLADEYYETAFDTLTDYTEEELDAFYQANKDTMDTVTYYYRHFDAAVEATEDENGETVEPTDEEKAAALAQAEKDANTDLEKVQGNLDLVRSSEDYEFQKSMPQVGDYHYEWIMDPARQPGDATVFDITDGYYVVVFEERYRDETPTVDVRHILVKAENEDNPATEDVNESTEDPTDEAFAAAEKKAQEILAQWEAGEATEESFAALAEEYSADSGSNTNGGLYENVYEGQMIETFNDWIFDEARQAGDTGFAKNAQSYGAQGWHLIYFVGQDEPVWITSARNGKWQADLEENVEIVRTAKLDSIFD